jgi:hypothetical protein
MKSGDAMIVETAAGQHHVHYYDRQSYGDNNKPVHGATVGEYTVVNPNGSSRDFAHGPHANTDAAARRGANPNAKPWAAGKAAEHITSQAFLAQSGIPFRDKRGY